MGPFLDMASAKAACQADGFTWVDPPFGQPWRVDGLTLTRVHLYRDHGRIMADVTRTSYAPGSFGGIALANYNRGKARL